MLSDAQRAQLVQVVADYVLWMPDHRRVVALVGVAIASRAPASMNGLMMAQWLVGEALRQQEPTLFIHLVRTADLAGELPDVSRVVRDLSANPAAWQPGQGTLWVPSDSPFVDREGLREVISAMAGGAGPPVIAIEAPDGFGKRTMTAYIQACARDRQSFVAVPMELRRDSGRGVLAAIVARLRFELGLRKAGPTTHEEPERRAVGLARDIVRDSTLAKTTVWLLLHVVSVPRSDDGTMRFVDELIGQIRSVTPPNLRLRLVLLTKEVSQLALRNLPLEHRFALPDVNDTAVRSWLMAAVPGRSDEHYRVASAIVFEEVDREDPPPPLRLGFIALQCRQAHQQLSETPA